MFYGTIYYFNPNERLMMTYRCTSGQIIFMPLHICKRREISPVCVVEWGKMLNSPFSENTKHIRKLLGIGKKTPRCKYLEAASLTLDRAIKRSKVLCGSFPQSPRHLCCAFSRWNTHTNQMCAAVIWVKMYFYVKANLWQTIPSTLGALHSCFLLSCITKWLDTGTSSPKTQKVEWCVSPALTAENVDYSKLFSHGWLKNILTAIYWIQRWKVAAGKGPWPVILEHGTPMQSASPFTSGVVHESSVLLL